MNELPYPLGPGDKVTGTWINQLLRAIRRMKPLEGPGVSTRVTPDGTVISAAVAAVAAPRAAAPLAPFTVRLHKTEGDEDGQWEIYLPPGCCNVGGTCEPLNPPAGDTSGHEGDDPSWRSLGKIAFSWFEIASQTASGSGYDITHEAVVEIHAKPSAKVDGVDRIDNPARRLVWASVRDDVGLEHAVGLTPQGYENRRYRDTPGDVFEADVARITARQYREIVNGAYQFGDWAFSVTPLRASPIDVAVPQGTGVSGFDLVWVLAAKPPAAVSPLHPGGLVLDVKNVLCVRQNVSAAGFTLTGDSMTDVLDAETVYARIGTSLLYGSPSNIVEVLKDPEGVNVPSPDVVWLHLYDLKHNTVTADHRPQSLVNLQLFHA